MLSANDIIDKLLSAESSSVDEPVGDLFISIATKLEEGDKDLGEAIYKILATLQANPQLKNNVLPQEEILLVKAIRTYSLFLRQIKSDKQLDSYRKKAEAKEFSDLFQQSLKDPVDVAQVKKELLNKKTNKKAFNF